MQSLNKTQNILLLTLAVVGLAIFITLLPQIYPYNAVDFQVDRNQAISIASNYLMQLGYDTDDFHVIAIPRFDNETFSYLQEKVGLAKTIHIARSEDPDLLGYRWRIRWFKNLPRSAPQERFTVDISTDGRMVGFQHQIPDNIDWVRPESSHLTPEEAHQKARQFLQDHHIDISGYSEDNFTSQRFEKRTDHTFRWKKTMTKPRAAFIKLWKFRETRLENIFLLMNYLKRLH